MELPPPDGEFKVEDRIAAGFAAWGESLAARAGGGTRPTGNLPGNIFQDLDRKFYPSELTEQSTQSGSQLEQWYTHNRNWLLNEATLRFSGNSFYRVIEQLRDNPIIREATAAIDNGSNVVIASNHASFLAPPLVQLAIDCAISRIDITQRSDIIVNKAVAWLEMPIKQSNSLDEAAYINALGIMVRAANAYCAIPSNTENSIRYGLDEYATDFNIAMLKTLARNLKQARGQGKGRLLTASLSGSLDVMPTPDSPYIKMKKVQPVTAKLISSYCDFGLFAAAWADPTTGEYKMEVSDHLAPIHNDEDVHNLMEAMEAPYYRLVNVSDAPAGIQVLYDRSGSLA